MLNTAIKQTDPHSPEAHEMMRALWEEIQVRYGFTAPNPFPNMNFDNSGTSFWTATIGKETVGSIAIFPLADGASELDMMYVRPSVRGTGVAHQLMQTAVDFAADQGYSMIRLRTGEPQPEAIRFYEKLGFYPISRFGRWVDDDTAICYEKKI